MPPTPDLSFTGLDEFVNKPVIENKKSDKEVSKVVRKSDDSPIIEDWLPKAIVNSARLKAVVNAVKGNNVNAVKASACWVWKLKTKVLDHVSKHNSASITLKKAIHKWIYRIKEGRWIVDAKAHVQGNIGPGLSTSKGRGFDGEELVVGLWEGGIGNKEGINQRLWYTLETGCGVIVVDSLELEMKWWGGTPQQNGVAERRNRTLIEAARTMLADFKLPTTFWAEAVNTACYVQNRVCPVTILNTIDHLGKFDGKAEKDFFVGYSLKSKAFRVFNNRTRIVEENLHSRFSKSTPNIVGTQSNGFAGTKASDNADPKSYHDDGSKPLSDDGKKVDEDPRKDSECKDQEKEDNVNNTNNVNIDGNVNIVSLIVNVAGINEVNDVGGKTSIKLPFDLNMSALEDDSIFDFSRDYKDDGALADMNNLDTTIQVSPNLTTKIHKEKPFDQVIGDLQLATQTRKMSKNLKEHGFVITIQQRTNHKDLQNCLFACFLSQEEPKKEELLHLKLQEVWTLVDLPNGKRAIGTKWVFRNKKDERGIVIKNKARLVAQGYTQEEGIDYDEVFALVARIEAIRLFLAYASFKNFIVYHMDVKGAFHYGKIEEEVCVCQPPGFEDPDFPDRVYKVEKALYGLHQASRAWYETLSTYLLDNGFQRGTIDKTLFIRRDKGDILLVQVYVDDIIFGSTKKSLCIEFERMMHKKFQMSSMGELTFFLGLQVKRKEDGIFISQDKYVTEILKKFGFTDVKTASTPIETQKPLLKDEDGEEVDVYMYRSMIGSLMYLTSSRPDIMFAMYSPFELVAYTNSDYTGGSLDRKSTKGGCQFLGCRLISWQCKKQTVVANSITEFEYIAALSGYGQVL
ncbi:putative ribonuclease H-like domain-containing protein [Tanacetum coccineum]